MPTEAQKARERFLATMEKSFGPGTAQIRTKNDFQIISTGSIALDRAMATGGYVKGRLTEVWGPPAGGKSSLVLTGVGEAHKSDPRDVIYVDVEHTYDPIWAAAMGADPERIIHVDPLSAENVADSVKNAIRSDAASMVIIDSIGAVLTDAEFEKNADESNMGKRAQVVARMINIAVGEAARHNVAVVIINQARANFGYGADTKPSGGFTPAHSMTHRLNVKRASSAYVTGTDENKVNVGYEMGVKVERNKVGPEGRNVKFDFYTVAAELKDGYHPVGIDKTLEALTLGIRDKIILQGGSYYTFPDGEKIKTKESAKEYLGEHPKMVEEIRAKIISSGLSEVEMDKVPELTPEQVKELKL